MKSISKNLVYPGATIDQVSAMLWDPEFRKAVCVAQEVVRDEISITRTGDGARVEMLQVHSTQGVPGFAKKIVGEETDIETVEVWSSAAAATLEVTIPGKPGQMAGRIELSQTGDGVSELMNLDITVGIPLVGGKIEGLIADMMSKAMDQEHRVGLSWLAG